MQTYRELFRRAVWRVITWPFDADIVPLIDNVGYFFSRELSAGEERCSSAVTKSLNDSMDHSWRPAFFCLTRNSVSSITNAL